MTLAPRWIILALALATAFAAVGIYQRVTDPSFVRVSIPPTDAGPWVALGTGVFSVEARR